MVTATLSQTPKVTRTARFAVQTAFEALKRPYQVTPAMALLVALVPLYIFIPAVLLPGRMLYKPALPLDELLPVWPSWVFVYAALYLFLIVLPVLAVREDEHIRRTVLAYLFVWVTAYLCFVAFPTLASRPPLLSGANFGTWGLGLLYSADPPYNCFPSLHVAHSFVSAFTCYRIHRAVGAASGAAAFLVGVSTLFTKQHYLVDVVAGFVLAWVAYLIFLRRYSPARLTQADRAAVAALALGLLGLVFSGVAGAWLLHQWAV